MKLVIPAVIVNSFCLAFTPERLAGFAMGLALSALLLAAAILLSRLLFPRNGIHEFAAEFSNAGFLGIPLVQGAVGTHAVFYIAGFIAMLNNLQATYGVRASIRNKRRYGCAHWRRCRSFGHSPSACAFF